MTKFELGSDLADCYMVLAKLWMKNGAPDLAMFYRNCSHEYKARTFALPLETCGLMV